MKMMISRSIRPTWRLPSSSPAAIAWRPVKTARHRHQRPRGRRRSHRQRPELRLCTADRVPHSAARTRLNADVEQIGESRRIRYTGPRPATTATIFPARRSICRTMLSALTISMTTATGATIANYGHVWFPTGLKPVGRPITKAIGTGFLPGDGPGSMTLRGATRPSITDAG